MRRYVIKTAFVLLSLLISLFGFEIRNDWYIVDGQKFFIKGIGYETHTRPGQVPWEYEFNREIIEADLRRIKAAGFNTIRTWGALTEEELNLVKASGLRILFGIWIDPSGDFGDPNFINDVSKRINNILDYTTQYNCILAYIIMNEPKVNDVIEGGPADLVTLWQNVSATIHSRHPGIPVTISNTAVGDYIRSDLFQIGAYNLYIYNPVLISSSHGYAGYCEFLKRHRSADKPFIVTEFGLSVSPGAASDTYGYGGNTPEQQSQGILEMYRGLIDGGAQGGCVFQYHDGWWKAGDENSHDNHPEEWFGLIEFDTDPGSYAGTPRPAWPAIVTYNKAIIWQPKNQQIYTQSIPVELFLTEEIEHFTISTNDSLLLSQSNTGAYFEGAIRPAANTGLNDIELDFQFFDADNVLVKTEKITTLYTHSVPNLPNLELKVLPNDLNTVNPAHIIINLAKDSVFSIVDDQLDYAFFPHTGFAPGEARAAQIPIAEGEWQFTDFFNITDEMRVATFGAGFSIKYGTFIKRIYTEKIVIIDDWANSIAARELISNAVNPLNSVPDRLVLYPNYPNPFNASTTIAFSLPGPMRVLLTVYDLRGHEKIRELHEIQKSSFHHIKLDGSTLNSGIYLLKIQAGPYIKTQKLLLLQ